MTERSWVGVILATMAFVLLMVLMLTKHLETMKALDVRLEESRSLLLFPPPIEETKEKTKWFD